ncbi:D-alanyl-D-alanine carboxypeptidase/D-alanyl-D-alanine-endopeptidase [Falsihalocynthiibacter sp. S25ZX9]|uniref:D-alanyl-D-alanine carboxypeptidase/D-alanyl-D-alanine endopeptidase n=1 Tax=Falsihalocynthiibacter sp. S25ZX9 TaxID=3240870 RepID=UPI00350EC4D3
MSQHFSRRFILAGLMSGSAVLAQAGAPETSLFPPVKPKNFAKSVANPTERIVAGAGFSGDVGFVVADATTGEILESRNAGLAMPPASVAKAITALYALQALGLGYEFSTRLVATGPISNGILNGDLVLLGGGDPTLNTDALAVLAQGLKNAGVREVTGDFLVHSAVLPYVRSIDKEQPDHLGYNPAVSGLNLNFNRVHFEWKRANSGYSVAMDARSDKYRPEVHMAKMVVKKRATPIYTYADGKDSEQWTVASGALGDGGSRWLPVRKPELYAADVFSTMARSQGIKLGKERATATLPKGSVIAQVQSEKLQLIVRDMLKYSTNITAEVIGLSATRGRGISPRNLATSGAKMSSWAGPALGMNTAKFVDHSGLSGDSRVPANEMVSALVAAKPNGALHGLMKDIVLKGPDGKKLNNAPATVRAKTGTLNFVSALAGYITLPNGRVLAFAIFTADLKKRTQIGKSERERPAGGRAWAQNSRKMQQELLQGWARTYAN